ncbi:hypothetical protein [Hyalangium gracile]|uniref:hypothetical protein n=1 Tax=Hyalangium gracile TaxID=394092 RepID=UPI001CCA61CC|nr:hypothetical protein [Hyalangium gracile]
MPKAVKNLFSLVVAVAVIAALYVAVKVVPFYVDHMDVVEAVDAAFNLAAQTGNDGQLRAEIRSRTGRMGTHVETDSWGVEHVVPGLGLTDEQIEIERSKITDDVRIEVSYQREVEFGLFNAVHVLNFSARKEGVPSP